MLKGLWQYTLSRYGLNDSRRELNIDSCQAKEMRTGNLTTTVHKYGIAINTAGNSITRVLAFTHQITLHASDLELYVETEEQHTQWLSALKHAHDYHASRVGGNSQKFASAEAHADSLRPKGRPRGETTVLESFQQVIGHCTQIGMAVLCY